MVECAMYGFDAYITTFMAGKTGCLSCLVPETPTWWQRQFPVLGAVSGTVGCLGAVEVVKIITGIGEPLAGTLLNMDLASMEFRRHKLSRDPQCKVCGARRVFPVQVGRQNDATLDTQ